MLLIINGSEVSIHPTLERRQIVRGGKGRRRQRVPQITCEWKEAGTISIDARVAHLHTEFM